jgi:predicted transcriptional regulator
MSLTTEAIELLKRENMTASEIVNALDMQEDPNTVHCVLTSLKKRNLIKAVGKTKETNRYGQTRSVSVYTYIEQLIPVKFKEGRAKKRKYRINLTKTKNMNTLRAMIVKSNPQFMLYQKELKLLWID